MKVAIIGPESTGKTTLAKELAQQFHGTYVPEYAREYIERKRTREVTYDELCEITRHQIEQIESLSGTESAGLSVKNEVNRAQDGQRKTFFPLVAKKRSVSETVCQAKPVFFDTELIVSKIWFSYAFGRVPEWLNEAILRYPMDLYLLTAPDIPWQPDPARYNGSDAIRQELFDRYESEIQSLRIPYFVIPHPSTP